MREPEVEVHHLSPHLAVAHRFDRGVKADLFTTFLHTGSGGYLVDPFEFDPRSLGDLLQRRNANGIIVTNENHIRASRLYAAEMSVPLYAHSDANIDGAIALEDGAAQLGGLEVCALPGGPPGEIALYSAAEGGTIVIGDALINFGAHGFSLLPTKYCSDVKLMRVSLGKLVAFEFERMLFAHGTPLLLNPRERLLRLLES